MCTLHVFSGHRATKAAHLKQIASDLAWNSDGSSVIMLDECNQVYSRAQYMRPADLLAAIRKSNASRYIVHLRSATSWTTGVSGCHMFDTTSGDWIYCHNGVIREGAGLRVDSLILNETLDRVYPDELAPLQYGFANVIAIHQPTDTILIHRSIGGSLTTDGNGNWSSHSISADYVAFDEIGWFDVIGNRIEQFWAV